MDDGIPSTRKMSSIMTLEDWGFSSDKCHYCGTSSKDIDNLLMQCGKCKKVYYCSMKCFNADITQHQKICSTAMLTHQPKGLDKQQKHLKEQQHRTQGELSHQKSQQQISMQPDSTDENEKFLSVHSRGSLYDQIETSGVQSGSDDDDKVFSSDDDNKVSTSSFRAGKKKVKKKKERKSSSSSSTKEQKPIINIEEVLIEASSKKRSKSATGDRPRSRSGSRKNTPTRRREVHIDKLINSNNDENINDVSEAELGDLLNEERSLEEGFLNLKTTTIVGQIISQKQADYYGEESFDDNSIFVDLTGKTIELILTDDSDSDSGNISDVTYDDKALLGSDEDDSGNDDEDLTFHLPWDGTKSYSNIDPFHTNSSGHRRSVNTNSNLTSTKTWNGKRYCKNPGLMITKELDCDPPEEAFKRTSMIQKEDSRKSMLIESNSGHSRSRPPKSQTSLLEGNSGHSKPKINKTHDDDDIPQFISINAAEYFDQSKLNHVQTVKREIVWEVPEWVNGVLLRRKRLAGNIVDTVVVTPNDPDYYEEGTVPKVHQQNLQITTSTVGNHQYSRHSLNNASTLERSSGSDHHPASAHHDIDLIEKAYFFDKPPSSDSAASPVANYLTKQRRKSLKSLQSNDVVVINKRVIDDLERSSSPTPDMIRERYGFR
jgi:MYND finger